MIVDILFWGFWISLLGSFIWYLFFAKTYQSISSEEATLRWNIHKTNTHCTFSKIQYLHNKKDEIIGFKCGCGFEFKQKRLIIQRVPHNLSK